MVTVGPIDSKMGLAFLQCPHQSTPNIVKVGVSEAKPSTPFRRPPPPAETQKEGPGRYDLEYQGVEPRTTTIT